MFDTRYETIPSNMDDLQPGPELGGVLACIDVDDVSPHDRVTVLRAHARQRAFHDAEYYRAMTAVRDGFGIDDPRWASEAAEPEIQCALHLTRRATGDELAFAVDLRERLPRVWTALFDGDIDLRRAKVLSHATIHLPVAIARNVIARIIDAAKDLTSGQLRARLVRLCIEADPSYAQQRYRAVVKDRRVVLEPTVDGTAHLHLYDLPPHRATAISRSLHHTALHQRPDDGRTMDQRRADIAMDLLEGTATGGVGAVIHVTTNLDTLAGLSEHPGELNGCGPVIADIARQVAAHYQDAEWRFSVTDPATGELIVDGITRRRPTTETRRTVEARDRTCVFPGCRMPAVDCDFDHTRRWSDGGATTEDNGAPLCRHNHIHKDTYGWQYTRQRDGRYRWASPLGHIYYTSGRSP
jgi:Domain of unknown function (DUF222)/HNH endonuclease